MTLELKRVSRCVGEVNYLADVSATFTAGHFNVLLGTALAGKTSLLRLIAGLDSPTDGEIHLHDQNISSLDTRHRSVAFVYQEFVNYPTLSVFDNIASPLQVKNTHAGEIKRRVAEIAELLGVADLLRRRPTELSGGQQQRVAIGRALAKDADVILLDEPLANLDYKLREELRRNLPDFLLNENKVVLYATTEAVDAFILGGKLFVLDKGRIIQSGSVEDLFARPANQASASILSDLPLNLVTAKISNRRCELSDEESFTLPAHMTELPAGSYTVGFRAEHVRLAAEFPGSLASQVQVNVIELTGSETIVHFDYADSPCVAIVDGAHSIQAGRSTTVCIDPERMFVFSSDGRTVATPPDRRTGNG